MRGLAFSLTCTRCGSQASELVNRAERGGAGSVTELVGIVRCCDCGRESAVTVHLRALAAVTAEQRAANERQRAHRARVAS